jgi:6-phosphogluconolactonase
MGCDVKHIVSDTPETLARQAAADFVELSKACLSTAPRFTVALSGGATPKPFYETLAKEPFGSAVDWGKIMIFPVDERSAPPDHPDSNYRMVKETLLDRVPVKPSRVYRIEGEIPPAEAARNYEKRLREVFRGADLPQFDLILLGLGADGHTASLMPGTSAMDVRDRWVAENVVRSLKTIRITLTFPVLNAARQVWFLVTGAKKKAVFEAASGIPNPSVPASLVRPVNGELRWYVDCAVANSLS